MSLQARHGVWYYTLHSQVQKRGHHCARWLALHSWSIAAGARVVADERAAGTADDGLGDPDDAAIGGSQLGLAAQDNLAPRRAIEHDEFGILNACGVAAVVGVEDFLDGAYFLFDETILVVHGPPPLVLYGVLVVRRCQARHRSQRAWQSPRCVKGLGKRGVRLRTTKLAANKKELSSGPRNA